MCLTISTALAAVAMATGLPGLRLTPPGCPGAERVIDFAHAPAFLVGAVAAPAARPAIALQLLEQAVLERAFA